MNTAISCDYPWALLGFAVFVPLILDDIFSSRGKRILKSLPKYLRIKILVSRLFFRLFLACFIIALAGPHWGVEWTAGEYRRGLDAVIALDVSRSMEVRDGQSGSAGGLAGDISRLERGLTIVRQAVAATPGTRFAVAVSRNRGIIAVPLSWDNGTALGFLEAIDGSSLTGRGTNLESLVDAAAGAFQSSHPSSRVIILVSDGEALSGSLKAALDRCNRDGIAVIAVAVGSDEGGEVPGEGGIISRRDTAAMRMAAGRTGGDFIDGNRQDAGDALAIRLRTLAPESETGGSKKERKARWFIFIMLAILAFGASKLSLLKIRNEG